MLLLLELLLSQLAAAGAWRAIVVAPVEAGMDCFQTIKVENFVTAALANNKLILRGNLLLAYLANW